MVAVIIASASASARALGASRFRSTTSTTLVRLLSLSASSSATTAESTSSSKETIKKKKKIVITTNVFDSTLRYLENIRHHHHHHHHLDIVCNSSSTEPWSRSTLISHTHDAHAIFAFMTDIVDSKFLDECPNLELVACALKGYDNFDIDECSKRNVAVTVVPDLLTRPTAELAITLSLGLGRRILEGHDVVKSRKFNGWRPTLYGRGLAGSNIGIFGAGAVGRAVAKRVAGFEPANIYYVDPVPIDERAEKELGVGGGLHRLSTLNELLGVSDVVFVCTPLTDETRHVINHETIFNYAKPGLHLINISRGSCVSESAVADGLVSGHIGGYAADVFEFEDWALSSDGEEGRSDTIEPRLLDHPRTLFTPHLGSAVETTRKDIEMAAAMEVVRWLNGKPYAYRVN